MRAQINLIGYGSRLNVLTNTHTHTKRAKSGRFIIDDVYMYADLDNCDAWIAVPDFRFSAITSDLDRFTRSDRRFSDRKNDSCTRSTVPRLDGGPISVFGSDDGGPVVTHLVAALNMSPPSCVRVYYFSLTVKREKNSVTARKTGERTNRSANDDWTERKRNNDDIFFTRARTRTQHTSVVEVRTRRNEHGGGTGHVIRSTGRVRYGGRIGEGEGGRTTESPATRRAPPAVCGRVPPGNRCSGPRDAHAPRRHVSIEYRWRFGKKKGVKKINKKRKKWNIIRACIHVHY